MLQTILLVPSWRMTHASAGLDQVKAWCYYESRLLGAHHGLISTYALETMVLYIFMVYHKTVTTPLKVHPSATLTVGFVPKLLQSVSPSRPLLHRQGPP